MGFGIWVLGFGIWDLGFANQALRLKSYECWVAHLRGDLDRQGGALGLVVLAKFTSRQGGQYGSELGFRVSRSRFRVSYVGCRFSGFRIQDLGLRV